MHGYPLSDFINIPTAEREMSEHDLYNLSYHPDLEYCVSGESSVGSTVIFGGFLSSSLGVDFSDRFRRGEWDEIPR